MSNNFINIDSLNLTRYPRTKDRSLKAWSSADEYLVSYCQSLAHDYESMLIINDQFGALTCSCAKSLPSYWTDSYLSKTAILNNLHANHIKENLQHINQTNNSIPEGKIFDLILIRIPKHNSLLSYQLKSLLPFIDSNTKIIAAGMTKEIHNSNIRLFESIFGNTTTSLAKKKARLIFAEPEETKINKEYNQKYTPDLTNYKIAKLRLISYGFPGVFSRESLDIGSRVLLNYMPQTQAGDKLIDLGCGTGILGTAAAIHSPNLDVTFTDESWLAIESAKKTFEENMGGIASYKVTDVLDGIEDNQYDYILCNPPFHQQNVQTLAIAEKMFVQSAKKLKPGGELRVVANRHLKYRGVLNRHFSKVDVISKDPKFVVWLAVKR